MANWLVSAAMMKSFSFRALIVLICQEIVARANQN
ncbi:hypothetical protein N234_08325 [Ralstonia pickettii DTP0602]|nr:hypothetical protein N234_08325 [Ralstonia pickettii DTP0602]